MAANDIFTLDGFFTLQSLEALAGASAATLCVANGLQLAFNFNPRWLALAAAEFVCLGVVAVAQIDGQAPAAVTPYFLAMLNGFLVFWSAAGLTFVGAGLQDTARRNSPAKSPSKNRGRPKPQTADDCDENERRGFWRPWF